MVDQTNSADRVSPNADWSHFVEGSAGSLDAADISQKPPEPTPLSIDRDLAQEPYKIDELARKFKEIATVRPMAANDNRVELVSIASNPPQSGVAANSSELNPLLGQASPESTEKQAPSLTQEQISVEKPPEKAVESSDVFHTVQKGEHVWNILEGKGPDSNPVGGKSEILKGMAVRERQAALEKLLEYYENNPKEAMAVGAVKSQGDIGKLYPGERLNITVVDQKLRELTGQPAEVSAENTSDSTLSPAVEAKSEAEPISSDITDMKLSEILALQNQVAAADEETLKKLQSLDLDPESYQEIVEWVLSHDYEEASSGQKTLGEYLALYHEDLADIDSELKEPAQVEQSKEAVTPTQSPVGRESGSISADFVVNRYVKDVEKTVGAGTFNLLKSFTFTELNDMAANDNFPEGVTEEGWTRWSEEMTKRVERVPADENETLEGYVHRLFDQAA